MSDELELWAPELAGDLDRMRRELGSPVPSYLAPEADRLADTTRTLAPRRTNALRASILARGLQVLAGVPYAELQSAGGVVKALRHGYLTIPLRPGYQPGPNYVTVRGRNGDPVVIRSGTLELWALRRRQVRIRGSRYLQRALDSHLAQAGDRVSRRLVDEVTRG